MLKKVTTSCAVVTGFVWIMMEVINPGWTINVLLGIDILANTILWGEVETISARSGKEIAGENPGDQFTILCWFLDIIDPDHCKKAAE